MADKSQIQWTDATWNPTTGCTKVSPGCANCYIESTPAFRIHGRKFVDGATDLRLHPDRIVQPHSWRRPRRVFVNSLSDLFHEDVPETFILSVFSTMARASQHQFQVLTKRDERMRAVVAWLARKWADVGARFPIPNVWLGVSVENARFRTRIETLRATPAAIRFVSFEPLLEDLGDLDLAAIDWAIFGGESGVRARPCNIDWIRNGVRQCRAQGVAPFVKQLGAWPYADWRPRVAPLKLTENGKKVAPFLNLRDRKGGDATEWPEDLRIGEWPKEVA